jgi:hypothetical protein
MSGTQASHQLSLKPASSMAGHVRVDLGGGGPRGGNTWGAYDGRSLAL